MLHQLTRKLRHNNWPETLAEVQICKYNRYAEEEGPGEPFYYAVGFTYTVNGHTYEGGLESPVEVQIGDKFPIRYNPSNPARNSAEPYGDWEKYYDIIFVIVIAGGILWYYLTHK